MYLGKFGTGTVVNYGCHQGWLNCCVVVPEVQDETRRDGKFRCSTRKAGRPYLWHARTFSLATCEHPFGRSATVCMRWRKKWDFSLGPGLNMGVLNKDGMVATLVP